MEYKMSKAFLSEQHVCYSFCYKTNKEKIKSIYNISTRCNTIYVDFEDKAEESEIGNIQICCRFRLLKMIFKKVGTCRETFTIENWNNNKKYL